MNCSRLVRSQPSKSAFFRAFRRKTTYNRNSIHAMTIWNIALLISCRYMLLPKPSRKRKHMKSNNLCICPSPVYMVSRILSCTWFHTIYDNLIHHGIKLPRLNSYIMHNRLYRIQRSLRQGPPSKYQAVHRKKQRVH